MMTDIERSTRLALILSRMRDQTPLPTIGVERYVNDDVISITMRRREWALVRACVSAEYDRAADAAASKTVDGEPIPRPALTPKVERWVRRENLTWQDCLCAAGVGLALAAVVIAAVTF